MSRTFAILVEYEDVPDGVEFEEFAVPLMNALRTHSGTVTPSLVTAFIHDAAEAMIEARKTGVVPEWKFETCRRCDIQAAYCSCPQPDVPGLVGKCPECGTDAARVARVSRKYGICTGCGHRRRFRASGPAVCDPANDVHVMPHKGCPLR